MWFLCHSIFNFAVQWSFPRIGGFWGWTRIHSRVSRHIGLRCIPQTELGDSCCRCCARFVCTSGTVSCTVGANNLRRLQLQQLRRAHEERNQLKMFFSYLRACLCLISPNCNVYALICWLNRRLRTKLYYHFSTIALLDRTRLGLTRLWIFWFMDYWDSLIVCFFHISTVWRIFKQSIWIHTVFPGLRLRTNFIERKV